MCTCMCTHSTDLVPMLKNSESVIVPREKKPTMCYVNMSFGTENALEYIVHVSM